MAKRTLEDSDVEILANVNDEYKGHGEPSPTTKRLIADGFIDIVFYDDGLWSAKLTKKAEKIIKK